MELPTFDYERQYWDQGIGLIAGVDEVGIGALAGPVVAGAVVFKPGKVASLKGIIRDSKQLTAAKREVAVKLIKRAAIAWAVGEATVEEISELNIRVASHLAMRRAVEALPATPDLLLIDGNPAQPHPKIMAVNIINGDELSLSIAAASIMAKVHRDGLMIELGRIFPAYRFASNKGYGSKVHKEALAEQGPVDCHRSTFAPIAELT